MRITRALRGGAAAAALLAGLTLPASATIYTVTYTGIVTNDYADTEGLFGPANADLIGSHVKLVYTVDTTKGRNLVGSNFQQYAGGALDFPIPTTDPVTAVLTVGGVSVTLDGSAYGIDYRRNAPLNDDISQTVEDLLPTPNAYRQVQSYVLPPGDNVVTTTNPAASLSYNIAPAAFTNGVFDDYAYDPATDTVTYLEFLSWQNSNVTVKGDGGIPSVPEPASGALILAGLFGLGALRRMRAQTFAC